MVETIKEKNLEQGLQKSLDRAKTLYEPVLFSYSFRFEVRDLLPILTHPSDKNTIRIYWEQPSRGFSFAGLGSILKFQQSEKNNSQNINEQIKAAMQRGVSVSDNSLIGPRIIGGFAFNQYEGSDNTWENFPRLQFLLPECLGTSTDDGTWLTISRLVHPKDIIEKLAKEFNKTITYYENRLPVTLPPISRVAVDKFRDVPDRKLYDQIIFSVLGNIKPGKLEKVVISRSHHVKVGKDFSSVSAMQVLRNAYPKCTSFFFSFPGQGTFFGSTPERLIRLKNGFIQTEALAGTIARGNNMEEDRILAETLLDSHKEREEHNLVMEQIIRKLEPIIPNIQFPKSPQILKLKNVQHLQTPISGELENGEQVLDLVERLHPTSAVAGTPTDQAMQVIREMEAHDRGWYSGPIGWIDDKGDGEFYVALRSALVKDEEAHVFAGGGIVSESHPDTEWDETELKLQPIISALSGGQI